jgi:hypothetical protein
MRSGPRPWSLDSHRAGRRYLGSDHRRRGSSPRDSRHARADPDAGARGAASPNSSRAWGIGHRTHPAPKQAGNGRNLRLSSLPGRMSHSRSTACFRPPDPSAPHSSHARDRLGHLLRGDGAVALRGSATPGWIGPAHKVRAERRGRLATVLEARPLLVPDAAHLPRTHPVLPATRATTHVAGKKT